MSILNTFRLRQGSEGDIEPYTLVLAFLHHENIGQIPGVTELSITINLNAADELKFSCYKYLNGEENPIWDEITDLKLVYVQELDEYFQIEVAEIEEGSLVKNVIAKGAAECELSQSILNHLEINTEDDIARESYVDATVFYDHQHPECSLLHRALEECPQWSIRHVDTSLERIQRTFSADGTSVYDFFTGDVAKEIGCLFQFDSRTRQIDVYDLKTVCMECGERGYWHHVCPECGSTRLQEYGQDTTVYFDVENLAQSIKFETDIDSIKNCFHLEAGDDDMNAAVRNRNPNGSQYLYYFSDDCKHDMPDELVERLESYDALCAEYDEEYSKLILDIYENIDKQLYIESGMGPPTDRNVLPAEEEIKKINNATMQIVGIQRLGSSTTAKTVENAVKNFAKLYVDSGVYKVDAKTTTWNNPTWTGVVTLEAFADDEETATSTTLRITATDNYATYLEQRLMMRAKQDNDRDPYGNVYQVLQTKDLSAFKQQLTQYSLHRLQSFRDSVQNVIDILVETDQARVKAEMYEEMYLPYLDKLHAVEAEIEKRQAEADANLAAFNLLQKRLNEIHEILNFENYLGSELIKVFAMYKREDIYRNTNYIADGLDNSELLANAEEFFKSASENLVRSGESQHSISGKLIDFMAMPEFDPFKKYVVLGNWVNARIDKRVYRLRLVSMEIDFNDPNDISVEFSDVEKIRDGLSDTRSILDQAKKMASSYGSTSNKANAAKDRAAYVDDWVGRGLDLTLLEILACADHQQMTIDDQGLWMRRWDIQSETYDPEQVRIINNGLYYTQDNWTSLSAGIGHIYFPDPRKNFELTHTYGIQAETVIGRVVLSEEVGIWTSNGSIELNKDGYHQRVRNFNDPDNTFFWIEYFTDENSSYDVIKIDRNKFYINMPNGTFRVEAGDIRLTGSQINMDAADISMLGSNINIAANAILNLAGSDVNISGDTVSINSSQFSIAASDMYFDADSSLHIHGGLVCIEAGEFRVTAKSKIQMDCEGEINLTSSTLHMEGGLIELIGKSQIYMDGHVEINGDLLMENEAADLKMTMDATGFRIGSRSDWNNDKSYGIWASSEGDMTISRSLAVGKNDEGWFDLHGVMTIDGPISGLQILDGGNLAVTGDIGVSGKINGVDILQLAARVSALEAAASSGGE